MWIERHQTKTTIWQQRSWLPHEQTTMHMWADRPCRMSTYTFSDQSVQTNNLSEHQIYYVNQWTWGDRPTHLHRDSCEMVDRCTYCWQLIMTSCSITASLSLHFKADEMKHISITLVLKSMSVTNSWSISSRFENTISVTIDRLAWGQRINDGLAKSVNHYLFDLQCWKQRSDICLVAIFFISLSTWS